MTAASVTRLAAREFSHHQRRCNTTECLANRRASGTLASPWLAARVHGLESPDSGGGGARRSCSRDGYRSPSRGRSGAAATVATASASAIVIGIGAACTGWLRRAATNGGLSVKIRLLPRCVQYQAGSVLEDLEAFGRTGEPLSSRA